MQERYGDEFRAEMGAEAIRPCWKRSTWTSCPPS